MLADGKTSKDIARELKISVFTVDTHRSRLMRKLKLRTIGEVIRFALQRGLISIGELEPEKPTLREPRA